jgi:pimeloyl-ACP methyl ester carboxylesterase
MSYFITQDGCRLFYETYGEVSSGPVVVFLNGTMQNTLYWKPQCVAFQGQFPILTYDARAQGRSDIGKQKLSLACHTADLSALLEHLDIEKAHLVGLSHGAIVALALAANGPEQVDRIVLCSLGATFTWRSKLFVRSWLDILQGPGFEAMVWASLPVVLGERFLEHKARILSAVVEATVSRNVAVAVQAHLETLASYAEPAQFAEQIRVPTLVISASEDPLITESGARKLAALCKGQHRHLAGIGHSVPTEAPELFNDTVLGFLHDAQKHGPFP